jgi:hypothetical protein
MLQMSESEDSFDRIALKSIFALLFYGVPKRGFEKEYLQAMVQDQPNLGLVADMRKGSPFIRRLAREFSRIFDYKDSKVFSFYETRETKRPAKVCARSSPSGSNNLIGYRLMASGPWKAQVLFFAMNTVPLTDGIGKTPTTDYAQLTLIIPEWSNLGRETTTTRSHCPYCGA